MMTLKDLVESIGEEPLPNLYGCHHVQIVDLLPSNKTKECIFDPHCPGSQARHSEW